MTRILLVASLLFPGLAFACGGATKMADANEKTEDVAANIDPTHCAKQGELVGANCSYATGMMAQRVLEQGKSYTFTGSLISAGNKLDSRVAAPYTVGPEGTINVVANEVIETLVDAGAAEDRLSLAGKLLEVEGVTYFVATAFETVNT
jgi:hypothetical protein